MRAMDTINSIMNGEKGRFWNVLLGTVYTMLALSVCVAVVILIIHALPDSFWALSGIHFRFPSAKPMSAKPMWWKEHWKLLVGLLALYSFSVSLRAYGIGNDSTGGDSAAKPEVSK